MCLTAHQLQCSICISSPHQSYQNNPCMRQALLGKDGIPLNFCSYAVLELHVWAIGWFECWGLASWRCARPRESVFINGLFFCCRSLHHCSKNQNPDHLSIRGNKSFVLEQEWNLVNGNTSDDNAMIYGFQSAHNILWISEFSWYSPDLTDLQKVL